MQESLEIKTVGSAVRFNVHIQPKASKTEVVGLHGTALKIRVKSPPVDGKANEELLRFIAEWLDVSPRAVALVQGHTGRQKVIEVAGLTKEAVLAKI